MPVTYPLATLSAQVTATGITAPSYNDILQSLIAWAQSIFGEDILLTPDTQDYQLLAVIADAINDQNNAMVSVYNGFSPTYAQGAGLSSLVKINGIQRETSSNSTANVTITGVVGTVINYGIVQDENGNFWGLPPNVTIPDSGEISVTATCQTPGAIAAAPGTITTINTVVLGWQTVTNPNAATLGAPVETDAALRQRQAISTSLPSQTPLQAILGAVANVPGVTRYAIYENQSSVTDPTTGIPGHSIAVIVLGGDETDIAQVIEEKKAPGTGTYGTTSVIVEDPAGVPIQINFFVLGLVNVYVEITINPLNNYVASTGQAIINAIVNGISASGIGADIYLSWLYGWASLIGSGLEETFEITSLTVGLSFGSQGGGPVPMAFNQAAVASSATVQLTVL
jgi:uncharacterized phage protein gp47/JayE